MARARRGNFRRNPARRQPKRIIYVFSEGSVTEPDYLDRLVRSLPQPRDSILKVQGGCGVPCTIVESCLVLRRELRSKRNYALGPRDEIWAVFDVDDHPRVLEAYKRATDAKIGVAASNPCIEIWGLLHFGEVNAPMSRSEAQRMLRVKMPGYDHGSHPQFPWAECCERYQQAIANAQAGRKNRAEEGSRFPDDCPSTSFDKLVSVLLGNE